MKEHFLFYLIGISFFINRFGANHAQLYSTTNKVVLHWLNGVQALVTLIACLVLGPHYGVLGYAGGFLLGSISYAAAAAYFSYTIFKKTRIKFEIYTLGLPILFISLLVFLEFYFSSSGKIQIYVSKLITIISELN